MKKITLYIATSLDGYIARPDGDLDWLIEFPNLQKTDYGYNDFVQTVDTVIMGGKTYREILCMDVIWPYKDMKTYVISHTHNKQQTASENNIQFISGDSIIDLITNLKKESGKDIWLMGGGEIISMFLNHNLIDRMIITYIPYILGNGVPLFPKISVESQWNLNSVVAFESGAIVSDYQSTN